MIRTQIYLPDDLYAELKLLAATSEASFSELIRDAARTIVAKKMKKELKSKNDFVGAYKKKVKLNAGEMIDSYYRNFGK